MSALKIDPPLLNSPCPWATTLDDLRKLYSSPHTGAVTTRTNTLTRFPHNDAIHQYTFFNPETLSCSREPSESHDKTGSLNTLGYSPYTLDETLENIQIISEEAQKKGWRTDKPFVCSVTGSEDEVAVAYGKVARTRKRVSMDLYVEVNLSCPNIAGKPPPAYSYDSLLSYLQSLAQAQSSNRNLPAIPVGIKTPPYSNPDNFTLIRRALLAASNPNPPISFITATNTLGSSLLLTQSLLPALESADETGIGGLAGTPLHPLALGNVRMLRKMLDGEEKLRGIVVIGVGGVSDASGYRRMRRAGACAVALATALGRKGVGVFREIVDWLDEEERVRYKI